MDLLGGLTSFLGGGITGGIGTIVSAVYSFKSKQLDAQMQKEKDDNAVAMKEADAKIMQQEWTARTQIATTTAEAAKEAAADTSFNTALTSEPQRYAEGPLTTSQNWLMVVLDFLRGFIRPFLTIYLSVLTTLIYFQARKLMGSAIPPDQAMPLVSKIIDTVIYLTSTSVSFWFGQRFLEKVEEN